MRASRGMRTALGRGCRLVRNIGRLNAVVGVVELGSRYHMIKLIQQMRTVEELGMRNGLARS